jgi:CheY-like chemotaxis protein
MLLSRSLTDMSTASTPILHVDDDQNDLLLLEHACRAANLAYTVKSAADGELAIAYLSGRGAYSNRLAYPLPVLVLLDLKMPRKTGFEVLSWIRTQPALKRILVFIFTSSRHQEDIDKAYELGANAYLVKPVGFERLVEELNALDLWLKLNEKPSLPSLANSLSYCLPAIAHGILPA